jgi:hypothetical protein
MIFGIGLFALVVSFLWMMLMAIVDNNSYRYGKNRSNTFLWLFAFGVIGFLVGGLMMVLSLSVAAAKYLP